MKTPAFKKSEKEKIKRGIIKTLDEIGIKVNSIILFGSRAREKAAKYSDYDFLIITDKTFTVHEKIKISKKIRTHLSDFPIDVIIKSKSEIETVKNQIGTVAREALKEGVYL